MEITENPPAQAEQIPTINDTIKQTPTDGKTGNFEKILESAKRSLGKVADKVRGRGRPPNCKGCGNPETRCMCPPALMGGSPSHAGGGQVGVPEVELEIIGEAVGGIVETVTGTADYFLLKKALEKTDDRKWIEATLARCRPTERQLESISKLSAICLRKYGVGTEYCPEIGLATVVLGIGCRYAVAFKDLSSLPNKEKSA